MKTKHEYGNKPEGYYELEEEIAEDVVFQNDNKNAMAAFLIDQHHDVLPGNATYEGVQVEPDVEVALHTDIDDRRNPFRRQSAISDRLKAAKQ